MSERGSVSVVIAAGLAMAALVAALTGEISRAGTHRAHAQTAADAAALAAAQELVAPSGRPLAAVAAEYADRHGARLVSCACDRGHEVVVEVEVSLDPSVFGIARVARAAARAVVAAPPGARGLQAWFVARLACLFALVPGMWIVSGFRTRAEQARLHAEKPGLAAPPGWSMHERGLAADLGFESTAARAAAHGEAGACGLAFPVPGEPWHVEPAAGDAAPSAAR